MAGKVVGALATIGAFIVGGYKIYSKVDKINETVEYINVEQSMMGASLESIKDSLDKITDHQKVQDAHMENMTSAAKFYIKNQKALTEDAMEDALNLFMNKKKESSMMCWTKKR